MNTELKMKSSEPIDAELMNSRNNSSEPIDAELMYADNI
jgi:hypothetical protein